MPFIADDESGERVSRKRDTSEVRDIPSQMLWCPVNPDFTEADIAHAAKAIMATARQRGFNSGTAPQGYKDFDYRVVTDGDCHFSVRILRAYDVFEGRVVARADMWV